MQYFIAKDFLKIFLSSSSFSPPTFGHAEGSRPCCWVNTSETVTLLLQSKWFINFLLCISNLDSKQSRSYFLNVNLTYFIPWLIQIICPTGLYKELLYHHPEPSGVAVEGFVLTGESVFYCGLFMSPASISSGYQETNQTGFTLHKRRSYKKYKFKFCLEIHLKR